MRPSFITVHTLAAGIVGSTLVLAGCGGGVKQQVMQNAVGDKGTVTTDGNGAMHVQTSEGSFTAGSNSVPADWPTDAPVYAGSTVTYTASVNPATGKPGNVIMLTSTAATQTVVDFYKSSLKANGWNVTGTMEAAGSSVITATKDDRTLSLAVSGAEGQTSIVLGIEKGK